MRVLSIVVIVGSALGGTVAADEPQPDAVTGGSVLSVCQVLSAPLRYDGQVITIRGRVRATGEGVWLFDEQCPGVYVTEGQTWPSTIALARPELPFPLRLHSVEFGFDEKSKARADAEYRRLRKRVREECFVFTYTGMFETRRDWPDALLVHPRGWQKYAGFGHLGESPGQLLLKSEDAVTVNPDCGGKPNAGAREQPGKQREP